MNARLTIDLAEATRLTREGRLQEALTLLRGGGGRAPSHGAAATGENARETPRAPTASTLDLLPPSLGSGGAWGPQYERAPHAGLAGAGRTMEVPEALRAFVDRMGRSGVPGGLNGLPGLVPVSTPVEVPEGARFDERLYTNAAGTRPYKLYVPRGYTGQAVPLVVMLHGCTQSPDDFAAGTRMNELAEEHTFLVAYPAQTQAANISKCWNWFSHDDQQRGQGEPSLIAGITRQIMSDFEVDATRVYVAGLSAGGAAAAVMGATYPDLYAAVGVHSGLACGAARDMPSAFAAMKQGGTGAINGARHQGRSDRVPTIVFHGDRDATVNPVNGDEVIAQAKGEEEIGTDVNRGVSPGGMTYTCTVHADAGGRPMREQWVLHGAGHAWSGGSAGGSYTDPRGPDASREMVRFFLLHSRPAPLAD